MGATPSVTLGLVRTLLADARLAVRLLREPTVPGLVKAVPLMGALYLLWPLDIIPDLLPVLGQLDDLGVVLAAVQAFIRLCPDDAAAFHRKAVSAGRRYTPMPRAGDGFIDTDFRSDPS
jgi:uncharacterized membrane protein YkvA (DUF1232 family)